MSSAYQPHNISSYKPLHVAKQIKEYPSFWKLQEMKANYLFFGSNLTGLSTNCVCDSWK
jgi:hypothetical protein